MKRIFNSDNKSINEIFYVGIILFILGIILIFTPVWILGFLLNFLGLIFIIRWIIFNKKGIKYFNQIPNYDRHKFVGKDYSQYAGWQGIVNN